MVTKQTTVVSFSGGRTSAYMAKWLIDNSKDNLVFVFMNTGQEHEKTLEFVNRCDKEFGLNLVWLEAAVRSGRKSTHYEIVCYESASREGEPFEDVIVKYGITNKSWPHCNRELKLNPFNHYVRDHGLTGSKIAIGIRIDEIDRMSMNAQKNNIIYPLIKQNPTTKKQVVEWWKNQEFDLNVPEHLGNCVTCWKKSDRKLMTIAVQEPERFLFMRMCERNYSNNGAGKASRVFFRENKTVDDVFKKAQDPFNLYVDDNYVNELDDSNGCSDSCDLFSED